MDKEGLVLHILSILEREEAHGYLIARKLEKEGEKVSWGLLYPSLKEMEKNGLVRSFVRGRKKIYALTEKGRRYLENHLHRARHRLLSLRLPSLSWISKDIGELLRLKEELHEILRELFRISASRDREKVKKAIQILKDAEERLKKV